METSASLIPEITLARHQSDYLPLVELTGFFLPKGSISSHCILTNLLQALHFEGIHARIPACVGETDYWSRNMSLPDSIIDIPSQFKEIQSACLHLLVVISTRFI